MSGSSQAVIRTQAASPIGGAYTKVPDTPFLPSNVMTTRPFLMETVDVSALGGQPQPGTRNAAFELPLEVDIITAASVQFTLKPLVHSSTFARYVDYVGLAAIEEVRLRIGTEKLQTVTRDELFAKIETHYTNDTKQNLRRLCGGGLTPAQREDLALNSQEITVPLMTLLGLHLLGDLGQSLFIRGLGEKLRVEIDFAPANTLYEITRTEDLSPLTTELFESCFLRCDGVHVYEAERKQLTTIYQGERTMTFDEAQRSVRREFPVGESLSSNTLVIPLDNLSQPTTTIYIFLRWKADLDRVAGGGPVGAWPRGRDYFNVGGWYNPGGGANRPIVKTVSIKAGGSAFVLKPTSVQQLMVYHQQQRFKGSEVVAVLKATWSLEPTRENAVLGFFDPSQIDRMQLLLELQTTGGQTTIGAASNLDIGEQSPLVVDVLASTKNRLHFDNHLVRHPFNAA